MGVVSAKVGVVKQIFCYVCPGWGEGQYHFSGREQNIFQKELKNPQKLLTMIFSSQYANVLLPLYGNSSYLVNTHTYTQRERDTHTHREIHIHTYVYICAHIHTHTHALLLFYKPHSNLLGFDISADLTELGRTPVGVVCAGIKSILDIGRTLEYLETQGVPVVAIDNEGVVPAFFSSRSGHKTPHIVRSPNEAAQLMGEQTAPVSVVVVVVVVLMCVLLLFFIANCTQYIFL